MNKKIELNLKIIQTFVYTEVIVIEVSDVKELLETDIPSRTDTTRYGEPLRLSQSCGQSGDHYNR